MPFQPSKYQEAIFGWIKGHHATPPTTAMNNLVVGAVAGSGKTTTMVEGAKYVQGSGLFVAFNRHIKDELQRRLRGTSFSASTVHSLGLRALSGEGQLGDGIEVDDRKYYKIIQQLLKSGNRIDAKDGFKSALKLIDLARVNLTENDLDGLAAWHALEYDDSVGNIVSKALEIGVDTAKYKKEIDYTDMLWLPIKWGAAAGTVDYMIVDECQDLSTIQLELVLRHVDGGHSIWVGDRSQAIYGFAGADAESYDNIKLRTKAQELPLSICYRCAPNIVELAQNIVPQIEAAPDRGPGTIEGFSEANLYTIVRPGDLVLSRITAPLITACIELIKRRVHARVKGRDIGKDLCGIIDHVDFLGYKDFPRGLDKYVGETIERMSRKDGMESQMESLRDKSAAIMACYIGFNEVDNIEALKAEINKLFDDRVAGVTLSTIHKAKGLEAERVFIIASGSLPMKWKNQLPWQYQQERNLAYVAITRAMNELYISGGKLANGIGV